MANLVQKFYKGNTDEFKEWLIELKEDTTPEGIRKYNDILNSVVYISENYDKLPAQLDNFDGAIYAHGAIIAAGYLKWNNTDVSLFPPRE